MAFVVVHCCIVLWCSVMNDSHLIAIEISIL